MALNVNGGKLKNILVQKFLMLFKCMDYFATFESCFIVYTTSFSVVSNYVVAVQIS